MDPGPGPRDRCRLCREPPPCSCRSPLILQRWRYLLLQIFWQDADKWQRALRMRFQWTLALLRRCLGPPPERDEALFRALAVGPPRLRPPPPIRGWALLVARASWAIHAAWVRTRRLRYQDVLAFLYRLNGVRPLPPADPTRRWLHPFLRWARPVVAPSDASESLSPLERWARTVILLELAQDLRKPSPGTGGRAGPDGGVDPEALPVPAWAMPPDVPDTGGRLSLQNQER